MNIDALLKLKGANKEWTYAMVQYALYSLARYHTLNKSELSDDLKVAVEHDIKHYQEDYDKFSPFLKEKPTYSRGLKN